jgi:lipoprotein NlpI
MLSKIGVAWHFGVGLKCLRKGDCAGALTGFNEVIRREPRHLDAHNNRGVALQMLGRHQDAIDDFSLALSLNPKLPVALFSRGVSWKQLGDLERSASDHHAAVTLAPDYAHAHAELGVTYLCQLKYGLALESLTKAVELDRGVRMPLKMRGLAHFCLGDFQAAAKDYGLAVAISADPDAVMLRYLAQARFDSNASAELATNAARIRSTDAPAGFIGLMLGTQSAEAALARAVEKSARGEAQFYIGQQHLLQGRLDAAAAAFKVTIEMCPSGFIEHMAAAAELGRMEEGSSEIRP